MTVTEENTQNSAADWRLRNQKNYLQGARLRRRPYAPPTADWDHDHCEFCMARFSLRAGDLGEGYVTEATEHWVCPACFDDFMTDFQWTLTRET